MVYSYVLALGGVGSKIASYYIRANIRPVWRKIKEMVPGAGEEGDVSRRIVPGVEIQIVDMAMEDVIKELIESKLIIEGDHFIMIRPGAEDYREENIRKEATLRKYTNILRYWPSTIAGIVRELGPSRGVQRYRPLARIFVAKYANVLSMKIDEDVYTDIVSEPPREGIDFLVITMLNAGGGFGAGSFIDLMNIFRERYRSHRMHETNKDIYMVIVNIPVGTQYRISPEHLPGRTFRDLYASSAATLLDYMYLKSLAILSRSYSDGIAEYIWEQGLQLEGAPNYAFLNTHLIITTYKPFAGSSIEEIWIKHDKFVANLLATINSNIKTKRDKLVPMFADNYSSTISGLERGIGQAVRATKYRVRDPETGEEKEVTLPPAVGITGTIVAIKDVGIIWGAAGNKEITELIRRIKELRARRKALEEEMERLRGLREELKQYISDLDGLKRYIEAKLGDSVSTEGVAAEGALAELYDMLDQLLSSIDVMTNLAESASAEWSSNKGHAINTLNKLIKAFQAMEIPDIKAAVEDKAVLERIKSIRNDISRLAMHLDPEKIDELKDKIDKLSHIYIQYLAVYNRINSAIRRLEEILSILRPVRERASTRCSEALIKRLSKDCSIQNIIENVVEPQTELRIEDLRHSLELMDANIIGLIRSVRTDLVTSVDSHRDKADEQIKRIDKELEEKEKEHEETLGELEEVTREFRRRIGNYIRTLLHDLVVERILEKELVDLIVAKLRTDLAYSEKIAAEGLTLTELLRLVDEIVREQAEKGTKLPYSSDVVIERIKNYLVITDSDYSATVSNMDIEIFVKAFRLEDQSNILDVTRPRRVILYTEDNKELLEKLLVKTPHDKERLKEEAIPVEANGSLIMLVSYRSGVPLLAIKEFRDLLKRFFEKSRVIVWENGEEKAVEEWRGLRYISLLPREDYIEMLRGMRYALEIYEEYMKKIATGAI